MTSPILVVDDEEVLRNLMIRVLNGNGYKAISTESGEKALKIINDQNVSLVITDITMPGMSGIDLLKSIKSDNPDLPVLVMTGDGHDDTKSSASSAEADGFIAKPFQNKNIISEIDRILK